MSSALPEIEPVTREPLNAHTPAAALREARTPTSAFYVRNHFAQPALDARAWRLRVPGGELALDALRAMPQRELDVVLECAGNGRLRMSPRPGGTPWGERAVGCARFGGVPLRDLVGELPTGTRELLFAGADHGEVEGRRIAYERSLPLERALHPDTLVALTMNGAPLTPEHGAPARLLVPGWYGMASVKWLVEVRPLERAFEGFYQADHYVYREARGGILEGPVTTMRVKSWLAQPAHARVGQPTSVRGWAWSGAGPVTHVDVSEDGGKSWHRASLQAPTGPYAWTPFAWSWTPRASGTFTLLARAADATGDVQPLDAPWNVLGYGNNEASRIEVQVA